jgi:Na+-transporting NADH:ubiquinone oxidoreductase subunit NqrB
LGVVFLHFSYPGILGGVLPVPDVAVSTMWSDLVSALQQGIVADFTQASWFGELGTFGAGSELAAAIGGAALIYLRLVPWRIIIGALLGLTLASVCVEFLGAGNAFLPWYAHVGLGHFAFVLVFIATDPSYAPLTRPGRWSYGLMFGVLTIAIREMDPSHPEGTLFAAMLAALTIPLLDHLAVRGYSPTTARKP